MNRTSDEPEVNALARSPLWGCAPIADRFRPIRELRTTKSVQSVLAEDNATQQRVTVKRIAVEGLPAGLLMRLEHESRSLSSVRCASLPAMISVHRSVQELVTVSEFIDGTPLAERLPQRALTVAETLTVGRSLLTALVALQQQQVVHRGIRPSNIIVDATEPLSRAVLIDFGSPPLLTSDQEQLADLLETARYVSPELAGLVEYDVGEASDLYSVGAVLFHCLAGRPPFNGASVNAILLGHMTSRVPELRSLGASVPRALDELVHRLLRQDPRERYQSADAALADLDAIAAQLALGNAEPDVVIGARDRRGCLTEPAFVARRHELQEMTTRLEEVRHGRGGLIVVEAESGGGKSRLLAELAHRGACAGLHILRGQGTSDVAQRPFQLLDGLVEGLRTAASANPQATAELLNRIAPESIPAIRAALPALAELWESAGTAGDSADTVGEVRVLQSLAEFLTALGSEDRPALVILDDCQWADDLMLKLLRRWQRLHTEAAGALAHLVLVVAYRSDEVGSDHALRQLVPASHLRLVPLTPEEVRQLVESMAGPLPDEAVELIVRLADGSPFMASAVLRGLVESQALVAESTGWRLERLALGDLQSSNRAGAFLARRLELLPAETVSLL
ncbi:MAG: AAA family ATPase, partial [Planctomycetaceae bacterium]|nr:AAA family ATPase [Planctomycetaceae bacterium]